MRPARRFELRGLVEGRARGRLLVLHEPISFYGDVDPETGRYVDGRSVAGRIIVAPAARGSTVGAYILYALWKHGLAPAGIIVGVVDPVLVAGAVLTNTPLAQGVLEGVVDGEEAELVVEPPRAVLTVHPAS